MLIAVCGCVPEESSPRRRSSIGRRSEAGRAHIGITDPYRPFDEQVDLASRKGLHSHAHAGEFGFSENVSYWPWHWTCRAKG